MDNQKKKKKAQNKANNANNFIAIKASCDEKWL
jgi:hypothetical protein